MSEPIHPNVKNMSRKDIERTIFDIMTDNGMDEDTADKTIDSMSLHDMEEYLSYSFNDNDDSDIEDDD